MVYACGVFANAGNYKGFGDSKFVPNIEMEKLETLVKNAKFCTEDLWNNVKKPMFSLSEREKSLGMADKVCSYFISNGNGNNCSCMYLKGITTYFSSNCTMEDSEIVSKWLQTKHVECYNLRTFKTVVDGVNVYDICLASVDSGTESGLTIEEVTFEGHKFKV